MSDQPAWQGLCASAALAWLLAAPSAAASSPPPSLSPIDRAFQRLYSFDFPGSLAILEQTSLVEPGNPLVPGVRAGALLFMELDRLRILQAQFFMDDDNLVDGSARLRPDPQVRGRLFAALEETRRLAAVRIVSSADDVEALFALCIANGVETDYTALVERRTWRSLRLAPTTLDPARKLLARTPPFYDAYLNFGSLEYIVGELPFFVRWFVRYDGVEGSKQRGIEQLTLTEQHGRYYAPFARILLAVASLRDKKYEDAERLLAQLVQEFPENPLFRKELALARDRMRRLGK